MSAALCIDRARRRALRGAGTAGTARRRGRRRVHLGRHGRTDTRARAAGTRDAKAAGPVPTRQDDRRDPALGHLVAEHRRPGDGKPDRQDVRMEGRSLRPELRPAEGRPVRNVDRRAESGVIFSVSTNTGAMGSGFTEAVYQGHPLVQRRQRRRARQGLYDYGTDGFQLAKIIDTTCSSRCGAKGGRSRQAVRDRRANGRDRERELEQAARTDVEAAGDVQLINHDLDLSNAVQDTLSSSEQALQQNPDLAGMWTLLRLLPPADGPGGRRARPEPQDRRGRACTRTRRRSNGIRRDDRRRVRPSLAVVRLGRDGSGAAKHRRARRRSRSTQAVYGRYRLPFMRPYVIERRNVGNFGAVIPVYGPDYQTYFTTKWKKEFRTR